MPARAATVRAFFEECPLTVSNELIHDLYTKCQGLETDDPNGARVIGAERLKLLFSAARGTTPMPTARVKSYLKRDRTGAAHTEAI